MSSAAGEAPCETPRVPVLTNWLSSENIAAVSTPLLKNRSINLTQVSLTHLCLFRSFNIISLKNVTTSPSSTTMSESGVSTSFHQTDDLAVRAHASAGFLATRKITIRSDPALLTCFDAADKQLYDLWVPKT